MRRHRIDNDRTRRHMYRHAGEILYKVQMVNRDDLIMTPELLQFMEEEMRAMGSSMVDKQRRIMKHKYRQFKDTPEEYVPISLVVFNDYDIDYNLQKFVVEARFDPNHLK